jgi:hypothetical protein
VRRALSLVTLIIIVLTIPNTPASAQSATGVVTLTATTCAPYLTEAAMDAARADYWATYFVVHDSILGQGSYWTNCTYAYRGGTWDLLVNQPLNSATATANTAAGAPDSVDAAVQGLASVAGHVVAQVESLSGLYWAVSVATGPGGLPSVTTFTGNGNAPEAMSTMSSGSDSTSSFRWIADARLYWDPDTNGEGAVDGLDIANVYTTSREVHPAFRFYSTSQAASVTPVNGKKLSKVLTTLIPDNNVEVVEASPLSVNKYGSAGSLSLGATLKGEGQGGGGIEFSIGRTWNYAEGTVGCGLYSSGEHYCLWQSSGKSGATTAKSAEGVETWKVPVDQNAQLAFQATAWWRS